MVHNKQNSFFVMRAVCPACASDKLMSLYMRPFSDPHMRAYMEIAYQGNVEYEYLEGQVYDILECLSCGLLFQANVLTPKGAQRLYDVWIDPLLAAQWNREKLRDRTIPCAILNFVERYLNRKEVRILDYGAGLGEFCRLAKGFGFDVSAFEFSEERASVLQQMGVIPIYSLEGKEGTYDFINMSQVLEHLADPLSALQAIHRSLRDDGLVFLSVPTCRSLKRKLRTVDKLTIEGYKKTLERSCALQHINSFTHRSLKRICRRAGFTIVFRPLLFIGCSALGTSLKQLAKSIVRPFYYNFTTSLFLAKRLGR